MALLFYSAAAAGAALGLESLTRLEAACPLAFGGQWPDQVLVLRHDAHGGGTAAAAAAAAGAAGHARFQHALSAPPF